MDIQRFAQENHGTGGFDPLPVSPAQLWDICTARAAITERVVYVARMFANATEMTQRPDLEESWGIVGHHMCWARKSVIVEIGTKDEYSEEVENLRNIEFPLD